MSISDGSGAASGSRAASASSDSASETIRVLVLCTGNSCRSQMAEAFLARDAGARLRVASAGTHPTIVNPLTVRVLAERGIDWSTARSKSMDEFLDQRFDRVITVCDEAAEACPVFPGAGQRIHVGFEDPAAVAGSESIRLEAFRRIRDEIEAWAGQFVRDELRRRDSAGRPPASGGPGRRQE